LHLCQWLAQRGQQTVRINGGNQIRGVARVGHYARQVVAMLSDAADYRRRHGVHASLLSDPLC